jgi:hypothetical protein
MFCDRTPSVSHAIPHGQPEPLWRSSRQASASIPSGNGLRAARVRGTRRLCGHAGQAQRLARRALGQMREPPPGRQNRQIGIPRACTDQARREVKNRQVCSSASCCRTGTPHASRPQKPAAFRRGGVAGTCPSPFQPATSTWTATCTPVAPHPDVRGAPGRLCRAPPTGNRPPARRHHQRTAFPAGTREIHRAQTNTGNPRPNRRPRQAGNTTPTRPVRGRLQTARLQPDCRCHLPGRWGHGNDRHFDAIQARHFHGIYRKSLASRGHHLALATRRQGAAPSTCVGPPPGASLAVPGHSRLAGP